MPYKSGKLKGELTTPEIRKLIKAHNILVSIKIPVGAKRDDIISIIKKRGYDIDHKQQKLKQVKNVPVPKTVSVASAKKIIPSKTKEQKEQKKQKQKEKKEKQKIEKEKEVKLIKKEAVKEFKQKKQEAVKKQKPKDKPKPIAKKEDEVRGKEKVGRPKVDPKKIKK